MAKKDKVQGTTPVANVDSALAAAAVDVAPAVKTIGVKGPKGAALDAKITVLAATNPKRPNTKAFDVFSKYVDGMTVQAFMDAAGSEATPNMVYDAKHGFIAIEGYVVEVLPPKAPRVAKEKVAKAPKAKAEKLPAAPVDEQLARETVEEEA